MCTCVFAHSLGPGERTGACTLAERRGMAELGEQGIVSAAISSGELASAAPTALFMTD